MSQVKNLQHLRIPLKDIESATGDFDKKNHIGDGAYGSVYKAELFHFDERNLVEEKGASVLSMKELCAKPKRCSTVAIKRLVRTKNGQGEKEFLTEIEMLSCYKHPNVVSLLGFCDEGDELILVYEYASNGSLDRYLGKDSMIPLTWTRRLQICLDAAQGLNYLHTGVGEKYRIIHRDVKSSNILLGQNWEAKISDFGLSRISPANQLATFLMIDVAGTLEYLDPQYLDTRRLTKASDVFSFGVVLFEVLSGRLAFEEDNDDKLFLAHLAQHCFEQEKLDEITDPKLREEMEQNFSILDAGADGDSLNTFSAIAYQCLRENQAERPTMAEVIGQLQKALEFQVKRVEVLKISLEKIKSATNNFSEHNLIGCGGFGSVYLGELSLPGCNTVAVKRLDTKFGQGKIEFLSEITMLYNHQHENIIPLIGFCDEENEAIIIYEHAFHGSLDRHLNDAMVTWICRLKICIGAARALDYLHSGAGTQHRVIHRDVKSSNILLNHDWEAKISDFGLSRICPRNQEIDYVITNPAGTLGYTDPPYFKTGMLTKEADVYSFGVVLFEILCGRLVVDMAFDHKQPFSWPAELANLCLENKNLDEIVDCNIREQIELNSLNTFSTITYQCLREQREERPTMAQVVKELEKALEFQEDSEWEKKLPRDYEEIIKMSKSPLFYSTKKELYSRLSSGILLREGKVWFSLSMGGAKNEMTSATEFSYKNYKFHKWRSAPKSRFPKAAKMLDVSNLKIQIKITTQFLSPEIVYGAYLVFKFCDQRKISSGPMYVNLKYKMADEFLNAYFAEKRDDDWMMIEMCRFINHKKTADFEVLLESLSRYYCGSGAIFVEGIEFRAIHNMEHGGNVIKYETDVVESSGNVDEDQHLLCDYQEMIKRSNNYCVQNTSDEELYFLRSKGILIKKGEKLFFPTNANGKKCHMLSAKVILHDSSNVKYFDWKPLPQSRFVEVAELLSCQLFRIKYNVETQLLSPDTAYGCYLVYKLSERCRGLHCPVKSRDLLPNRKKNDTKGEHDLLHPKKKKEDQIVYFRSPSQVNLHKFTKVPDQREDGWMEVRVWEFITEAELKNDYHPMDLKLISYEGNMRGLIVCAIQFRPI